ncbi:hypothetical protein AAFF_G00107720 [Aldrovandia affinis]|uniref:Uncharacterized protein n=1 Tax=Aldrovandia affinis TaxID=143900 RepID=A0AAD7RUG5_9TELE|nr:hypothetical protein AAFF_G00107720 [Aldrovandia affinis]
MALASRPWVRQGKNSSSVKRGITQASCCTHATSRHLASDLRQLRIAAAVAGKLGQTEETKRGANLARILLREVTGVTCTVMAQTFPTSFVQGESILKRLLRTPQLT